MRETESELFQILSADLYLGGTLQISESFEYYRETSVKISRIILSKIGLIGVSVYSTGIESGKFVRLSMTGSCQCPDEYETNDSNIEFIAKIQEVSLGKFSDLRKGNQYTQLSNDDGVLFLFGRGEIFGFIRVYGNNIAAKCKKFFTQYSALINAIMSDQAFSFRMNIISQPLLDPTISEEFEGKFGVQVTDLVTRGFGADGSTLRLKQDDKLNVISSTGRVTPAILAAREIGELLSEHLFESEEYDWAAIILDKNGSIDIGGLPISDNTKSELRKTGLYSVLMTKLSGQNYLSHGDNYGTLSYYFLRSTAYSRRDVALFRSFSQKVGAYLSMHYSFAEIRDQKKVVELQSRFLIYSEVASLLAHDIWHKSNTVAFDCETLLNMFRKGLDRGRITGRKETIDEIGAKLDDLTLAGNTLHATTSKYKNLQGNNAEEVYKKKPFSVAEAIYSVEDTLSSVLGRRNIAIEKKMSGDPKVIGPKFLFEQVLYNLFLNSIQALSLNSKKRRQGLINVNVHVENDLVVIRVSDTGPGINHRDFPEVQDVFEIGRTSRPEGTGTGLPTARQVIGSHFQGNLTLTGRRPALFSIVVPRVI